MTPTLQAPYAHPCHGAGRVQQVIGIHACSRQGSPTCKEANCCRHHTLQLLPAIPAGRPYQELQRGSAQQAAASCSLKLFCKLQFPARSRQRPLSCGRQ